MQSARTSRSDHNTKQTRRTRQSHSWPTERFHAAHARAPQGDPHVNKVRRHACAARREGPRKDLDVQLDRRTSRAVHGTRGPSISVVPRQPSERAPLSLRARWWSEELGIHSRDGAECAARAGAHLGLVNQNRPYERDLGGPQVCSSLRASC